MGLFRRKKVEKIDLPDLKNEVEEIPFNLFQVEEEENLNLSNKNIINAYNKWKSEYSSLDNLFYIAKIYFPIAPRESILAAQILALDKHLLHLLSLQEAMEQNIIELSSNENQEYLRLLNNKLLEMDIALENYKHLLSEIKNYYYSNVKMATLNICLEKDTLELQRIYNDLINFLKAYKSIEEAAQYIYYNSGEIVQNFIFELVNKFKALKEQRYYENYPVHYFIKSDAIITLGLAEWVDLYNKVKFVIKNIAQDKLFDLPSFKSSLNYFELLYLVLMINSER